MATGVRVDMQFDCLMSTLNLHSNEPKYSNITVICTLSVPLMGGLLHFVRQGGAPPSPLLAVPNVTAHLLTDSVPTSCYSMWHYICPLKGWYSEKKGCSVPAHIHRLCTITVSVPIVILLYNGPIHVSQKGLIRSL